MEKIDMLKYLISSSECTIVRVSISNTDVINKLQFMGYNSIEFGDKFNNIRNNGFKERELLLYKVEKEILLTDKKILRLKNERENIISKYGYIKAIITSFTRKRILKINDRVANNYKELDNLNKKKLEMEKKLIISDKKVFELLIKFLESNGFRLIKCNKIGQYTENLSKFIYIRPRITI